MKQIVSHPEAEREWQTAAFFYAERDPELAFDFNKRIRQAEEQIAEQPERYPFFPGAHLVRKCRVHRFPFSILYIDRPN